MHCVAASIRIVILSVTVIKSTSMHCIVAIRIVILRVTLNPLFWQTWMDLWLWCHGSWVPWRPFFPQPQSLNWGVRPFTFWPPCCPFPQDTETQKSKTSFLLRLTAPLRYEVAVPFGVLTKPFEIWKLVISWRNDHFFQGKLKFSDLQKRISDLLFKAIEVENAAKNVHHLLGGLMFLVLDFATR